MKKLAAVLCVVGLLVCGSGVTAKADFQFPLQLTYLHWITEVEGADISIPVGLSVAPNIEFDFGGKIGCTVGPAAYISMDDWSGLDLPLQVWYGQMFMPNASVSPYIRVGGVYHLGLMDMEWDTELGFVGAVGVSLFRKGSVGVLVEVAYDSAIASNLDDTVDGLSASVGVVFGQDTQAE